MKKEEQRPWGFFETLLDDGLCKVKKISIKPGQAPSYQYHFRRDEFWIVVAGEGDLKIDGEFVKIFKGFTVKINREQRHQVRNCGDSDLVFIEVQTGEYFGEDDIVRLEDDYGRS